MSFQDRWHGAPLWVWTIGGSAVVVGGVIIWRKHKAASAASSSTPTGVPDTLDPSQYAVGAPPIGGPIGGGGGGGDNGLQGIVQGLGDFLQKFTQTQQDTQNSLLSAITSSSQSELAAQQSFMDQQSQTQSGFLNNLAGLFQKAVSLNNTPAVPVTTMQAGSPANSYGTGQVVNATTGEKIVRTVWSPIYGWIDQSNMGGIFTGGGGQKGIGDLPYGGSYLGYVANTYGVGTPQAQQELATHGNFNQGSLQLLPGGGYEEFNSRGEGYTFGS